MDVSFIHADIIMYMCQAVLQPDQEWTPGLTIGMIQVPTPGCVYSVIVCYYNTCI